MNGAKGKGWEMYLGLNPNKKKVVSLVQKLNNNLEGVAHKGERPLQAQT